MSQPRQNLSRLVIASAAVFGLVASTGGQAMAFSEAELITKAKAACLDKAAAEGWKKDLAKVISEKAISADKVEVVFDLTKDGTNTARLTCPYSVAEGATLGAPAKPAEPAMAPEPAKPAEPVAEAPGFNPWWLLLPLGLGLLGWAALRGKNEEVPTTSGVYGTTTTTTTTARNWFVEANAHDGQLEVREHPDLTSSILRRVRNGDSVQVTGHRRNDWLEVAQGGWVRDADVRYDRNTVRFTT